MSEKSKPADPPISGIAAVQCLRSGHALAYVLNYVGENASPLPAKWLADFREHLDEDGLELVSSLAIELATSHLCKILARWQTDNNLPHQSADEQLHGLAADDARRPWLEAFVRTWDMASGFKGDGGNG